MEKLPTHLLELKDLLGLAGEVGGAINQLWDFYIIVVLAVVGWLVTMRTASKGSFDRAPRITIMLGFAVFAIINWVSLSGHYDRFNRLSELIIKRSARDADLKETLQHVVAPFEGFSVTLVHPAISLLILCAIWCLTGPRPRLGSTSQD